jgi:hypothetical protein
VDGQPGEFNFYQVTTGPTIASRKQRAEVYVGTVIFIGGDKAMKRVRHLVFGIFLLILTLIGCGRPKNIFFFETMIPAHVQSENALQESIDYPPFLRPEGKRRTIHPDSQYFTLAVLNAVDISGRSQDIRKVVADIVYTELFAMKRFNLLDRGELVDLNPEWFVSSIKDNLHNYKNTVQMTSVQENTIEQKTYSTGQPNIIDSTVEFLKMQGSAYETMYRKLLSKVDGILLLYITSRKGGQSGGHLGVDYRIVNQIQGPNQYAKEIVLFAGKANLGYRRSSRREIEINRNDIKKIVEDIVRAFPKPQDIENSQIVKRDRRWIVINKGSDYGIIPGLFGYAAIRDDSIYVEGGQTVYNPRHFAYLAKFVVTEVYDKSCTALLLYPQNFNPNQKGEKFDWDVKVGDSAMIK